MEKTKEKILNFAKLFYLRGVTYFLYAVFFIVIPWIACCALSLMGITSFAYPVIQLRWAGLSVLMINALFSLRWVEQKSKNFYDILIVYLVNMVSIFFSAFIFDDLLSMFSYNQLFKQIATPIAQIIDISYRVEVLELIVLVMIHNCIPVVLHLYKVKKKTMAEKQKSMVDKQ